MVFKVLSLDFRDNSSHVFTEGLNESLELTTYIDTEYDLAQEIVSKQTGWVAEAQLPNGPTSTKRTHKIKLGPLLSFTDFLTPERAQRLITLYPFVLSCISHQTIDHVRAVIEGLRSGSFQHIVKLIEPHLLTPALIHEIVKANPFTLEFIPSVDVDLAQLAIRTNGHALYCVPLPLRTRELCEEAFNFTEGDAFRYFPCEFMTDDVCRRAVELNGCNLVWIPIEKQTAELVQTAKWKPLGAGPFLSKIRPDLVTVELCKVVIRKNSEHYMDSINKNEIKYALKVLKSADDIGKIVQLTCYALKCLPVAKRSANLCRKAIQKHPGAVRDLPVHHLTNAVLMELCELAILSGAFIRQVPKMLRTSAMVRDAVGRNAKHLYLLDADELTPELLAFVVQRNGMTLQYVPVKKRTGALIDAAIAQNGLALEFLSKRERTPARILVAVKSNPLAIQFVGDLTKEIAMAVVSAPSAPKALPRHVALAMIDHAIRNNQTCAITHEPITHDRMYYVTNCCGQVFDSNALRHWINQNPKCPTCNGKLSLIE